VAPAPGATEPPLSLHVAAGSEMPMISVASRMILLTQSSLSWSSPS